MSTVHKSLTLLFSDETNTSPPEPKSKECAKDAKKKQILPVFSNSGKLTDLTAQMDAMKKKRQRTSPENKTAPDSPALVPNVEKVWGEHLKSSVRKLNQRTASFQFAEKLYTSATFKSKRNPLKPHTPLRRTKSEVFSEFVTALSAKKSPELKVDETKSAGMNQEANTVVEDNFQTEAVPADDAVEDMETAAPVTEEIPAVALDMFDTKCTFKVKDSLKVQINSSYRVASKISSNMDEKWIERCTKPKKLPVQSSQESSSSKMSRNDSSSSLQSNPLDSQNSVTVGISACTLESQNSMVWGIIALFSEFNFKF